MKIILRCFSGFLSGFSRISRHYLSTNSNPLALTGIQPSGKLHLGNYLGVIKPTLNYYNSCESTLLVIIADLHALTSQNKMKLNENIFELAVCLLACGFEVNSESSPVFLQSSIRGHTELAWILSTNCSLPRLAHLPQWREKAGYHNKDLHRFDLQLTENSDISECVNTNPDASVGLFTYPILQAADILLYGAQVVPVGIDQITHIELARDLVRSALNRWPTLSTVLRVPESLIFSSPKVMITSLRNPTKKMSKSDSSELGSIFLTDTSDVIRAKIKRAQTDSYRSITYNIEQRPGIANLLHILSAIKVCDVEEIMPQASLWTKEELKSHVSDALIKEFDPIRQRIVELKSDKKGYELVRNCLCYGAQKANKIAYERLQRIYSAIGCEISSFLSK